jgi:5S rRNA maturation endonuclease (ribonuclease M5)
MDWDRTGGRLQRRLARLLEGLDMLVDQDTRVILQKNLKPETRVLESLYGLADRLSYYLHQEDPL